MKTIAIYRPKHMWSLCLALFSLGFAAPAAASDSAQVQLPVQTYTLDNGLTVLLSQDKRLPQVAVEVRYLVGSAHEEKGRTGFAHLFEHLMFQGSANFDNEYFAPFEPIGGSVNGTTNSDRTNYYELVPSEYLELALWLESDRMENFLPALTQEKLDNQRDVVKNERRFRYENRPYGMAMPVLREHLFPKGHPYHHATIGSHEDLSAASLADVKAFFARYYVPKNAVLTVVGDFEVESTKALIERYFGRIPAGERAPTPKTAPVPLQASQEVVLEDHVKLPRVYLAWPTAAFYAPGDAALDIFSSILTSGKTSRLYQPLVYEQAIAKDVAAYQASQKGASFFVIYATAAPGVSVEALEKALRAEVSKALSDELEAKEFERVLNGWRKMFFEHLQGYVSKAQSLSTYHHFVGDADYVNKDLARYTSLTPAKVSQAARTWIHPDKAVVLKIIPKSEAEKSTAQLDGAHGEKQ